MLFPRESYAGLGSSKKFMDSYKVLPVRVVAATRSAPVVSYTIGFSGNMRVIAEKPVRRAAKS